MKCSCIHIIYIFILFQIHLISYSQGSRNNIFFAEKNSLKFEYFNAQSGLSNNVITDFVQDSLGYIWISTNDGLNRYNGNEFFSFKKESNSKNSLSYNLIEQLKFTRQGELLIVTGDGLNIYNPKTESFRLIDETNGLIRESLTCLEFAGKNELIIGVYGRGVQFFNPDYPEQSTSLEHNPKNENSISSNNISKVILQGKNTLWIGTFDKGLNKVNYKTKEVRRIPLGDKLDNGLNRINCLFLDSEGNLWIGTKSGIVVLTKDNKRLHITASNKENDGLSDNEILSFEQDYLGNIWIGTQNGGLNIINLKSYKNRKNSIKWYLPNQNGTDFQGRAISAIMKDRDDNMWIGTNYGFYYVNLKGVPIKLIKKEFTNLPISISNNKVRSISERPNGEIWIGTDGGGLNLYNPTTGKYKYFKHDDNNPSSLSNDYIYDVLEDSKKRVWVGTYRGGLNLLNTLNGNCKKYLQGSVEDGNKVNLIYEDHHHNIWVGTNRGGLYKYCESKDSFEYISSLNKIDIRDITEDQFGHLWLATYGNGVIDYNPQTNSFDSYMMHNTDGFTSNIVYAIIQLVDKNFLVGTGYGGVLKLFPNKKHAINYTEKQGLSNNTINSMVFRNKNEIWLGTFKGLSYFNTTTETIKNLSSFDEVAQSDFNVGAALKTKDGLLYFGSNNGLYVINPDKVFNQTTDVHLVFETLKLFNNKVPVTYEKSENILSQALSYLDHIYLDHNQTLITIDFSVLKFPSSKNIKYSYLLKGYQDYWVNINNSHSINLSKLPPGTYDLVVKAIINPEKIITKNLLITINPPFWKTLPAYLIYLGLLAGMIWIGMKYYSERLKLKNSLLFEKKQRQLENELNLERVRFFTSFSHELKTPLSLIISPVEDLIKKTDKKKQKELLEMVLKNSKYLLKNIQKLLEFRKSEIGLNKLSIDYINISDYINQIVISYKSLAKSRGITFKLDKPKDDIYMWCDIEKIEIIIHNFLSNAFKYSEREGSILVSVQTIDQHLLISVSDKGKGISEQDLPHVFDWYYQSSAKNRKKGSGIGLALSKIFAELHMGSISIESKYREGTKITLDISLDAFQEKTNGDHISYTPAIESVGQNELISTAEIWAYQEQSTENEIAKSKIRKEESRELILIVDDNRDILQFLSSLLEEDYDLILAVNGSEGIKKAIKYVPDVIISDVMMPLKSGIDLCKTLKTEQSTSHIPIILLTAKADTEGINEGYEEGADDYITKPFSASILKTRIRNLIQNRLKLKDYFGSSKNETSEFTIKNKNLLDIEKAFLQRFENVIETLIDKQDVSTDAICSEMGMSRSSLFRKIKVLTGNNINEFVVKVRLKKAVHLIKYENYTISQASFAVGFNSIKHFRKLFKDEYGTLPSKLNDIEEE